jgi:hypothetical protein
MGEQLVRQQFAKLQKASISFQSFGMTVPGGGCGPRLLKRESGCSRTPRMWTNSHKSLNLHQQAITCKHFCSVSFNTMEHKWHPIESE